MTKPAKFFRGSNGHAFMVVRHDDIQVSIENLTKPWDDEPGERGYRAPRRNKAFVLGRFEDYRPRAGSVEITEDEAYS